MNGAATAIGIGGQLRRTVSGTGIAAAAAAANQMQMRPSPLGLVPPHRTQERGQHESRGGLWETILSRKLHATSELQEDTLMNLLPPRYLATNGASAANTSRWRRRMVQSVAALVILGVLFYVFTVTFATPQRQAGLQVGQTGYGIVIDAGSSGTRLHVFQYTVAQPMPHIHPSSQSHKIKPGLSSFASEPDAAGQSLQPLIEFARNYVPEDHQKVTPVYLMATAGLRLVDKATAKAILDSCRKELLASGFMFRPHWAAIISGMMEGVYAWVAANYALGHLGKDPRESVGIFELGGASAQVTFVPDSPPPPEFRSDLILGGVQYMLYTHSFLNFGQEEAMKALGKGLASGSLLSGGGEAGEERIDPCKPRGYIITSSDIELAKAVADGREDAQLTTPKPLGNFSECRRAALQLIQQNKDACLYSRCPIGNTFIPELRGKFFATENFFYTSEFLQLPISATLAEMEKAGSDYCSQEWSALRKTYTDSSTPDLLKYCFSASYIVALLHDALGLGMHDSRVQFTNKVGSVPVDWALGALIVEVHNIALGGHKGSRWAFGQEWIWIILALCGVLLVVIGAWSFVKSRKPPLTTIYDLEKGRYFTTQVGRAFR